MRLVETTLVAFSVVNVPNDVILGCAFVVRVPDIVDEVIEVAVKVGSVPTFVMFG